MNYCLGPPLDAAPDAPAAQHLRDALEMQSRELTHALWRLERARRLLVPGPVDFWRGLTKLAFDSAQGGLTTTVDDGLTTLRCAIDSTRSALTGLSDHG